MIFEITDEQLLKFEQFLLSERNLAINSVTSYLSDIKQFQVFISQQNNIENIQHCLQNYLFFLQEQNINNTSIARKISSIKQFYKFHDQKIQIILPKIQKPLKIIDHTQILQILHNTKNIRDKCFLYLLFATGCRISELLSITMQQIQPCIKKQTLHLSIIGKGRKERVIFITDKTLEILIQYIHQTNNTNKYLFQSKNGIMPLTRQWANKLINTIAEKLGMTKIHPHAFRHAQAMLLLESGVDLISIQKILGHSHLSSTERYMQLHWKHLQQAIQLHPFEKKPYNHIENKKTPK